MPSLYEMERDSEHRVERHDHPTVTARNDTSLGREMDAVMGPKDKRKGVANLPAGLERKAIDSHAVDLSLIHI